MLFRSRLFLVFLLLAAAGVIVPKTGKTARLYHLVATAAPVVWRRTGRNDRCRKYGIAARILVAVTITCTHAIVPVAAVPAETPQ